MAYKYWGQPMIEGVYAGVLACEAGWHGWQDRVNSRAVHTWLKFKGFDHLSLDYVRHALMELKKQNRIRQVSPSCFRSFSPKPKTEVLTDIAGSTTPQTP